MANAIYDKGREAFAKGEISWTSHDIKLVLIDVAEYTPSLTTHQYLSDVPSAARIATSGNLASKTATAGVCDAADVVLSGVTGDTAEALVIYRDTGTESTSPLIAYMDTGSGLPITPNGSDITIVWDSGAKKIFRL